LQQVTDHLYTPVGLKTLPKSDAHYIPAYGGDQYHRDSAYHEGTVWSWLLGPYVDAIIKTGGTKEKAQQVINDFKFHLNEAGIGTVSEIFDAEPPHHPRGCIAQAWGVAEVMRVIKDYQLYETQTENAEIKMEPAEL
jgi:glycogen debranching enzyme